MAGELRRDTLFVALTRPQMFAGVTYSFFVINAVLAVELFLIFRSFWVLLAAVLIHLAGMLASLREPRIVDQRWRVRLAGKQMYVNELFLTILRRPLQGRLGWADVRHYVRESIDVFVQLERQAGRRKVAQVLVRG